ncbi:MAG: hypothetical protein AAF399_09545 [Bacteroidota bacterium]
MKQAGFPQRIRHHPFLIRLRSWEYWPMHVVYMPVYVYWLYLSIRARAFIFFSAANPGIELGGFFDDAKWDLYQKIPERWIPKTCFIPESASHSETLAKIKKNGIHFPLIIKPNRGERGFLVEKIPDARTLESFMARHELEWIIQDYIAEPEEISVLYYRYPGQTSGGISSVTLKEFLHVTGNGHSTLEELILSYPRAKLQVDSLKGRFEDTWQQVIPQGQRIELMPIGNHSRGTTFLNGNAHIDADLLAIFDQISHELDGIYFGRFDMKCRSMEALKAGKDFYILEINGVKSEPTHIYQPGFSIWEAYRVLFRQWRTIFEISMANHARGVPFPGLWDTVKRLRQYLRYKKDWEDVPEAQPQFTSPR